MSAEQVMVSPVELAYTLTEEDWLDGFVAHRRRLRRPWLVPLLIAAALVGILLANGFQAMSATDVAILGTAAVVAIGLGLLLFRFLVAARWMYRWQVRMIMRANPWLSEPIRAVVDDAGLRLASASRSETAAWSQYLRYVETDRSFVLRASERLGAAVLVLPKRGLVSGDPAPLRALLGTHCRRSV
ncbi:YcxB family protein [Micromonospora sp. DH14]|uniref:YcxB family protein n=1 Tax=Micromonospora sp. DH14 TaxID=3040120 RepID=UPI002442B4DD|nr:YcxB family protein [Micromonospora sp. DH14]MDG9677641.1 YcxB family protein [Micromonospora sp. DH14]